ncbi:MAG: hypothetical protein H7328_05720 [Bdellovibrio sp.]|nr:hypothetical protein [Bdellovibrio sp.]
MLKNLFAAGYLAFIFLIFLSSYSFANSPKVGRNAAAKYFMGEKNQGAGEYQSSPRKPNSVESLTPDERYLTFGLSNYMSSDSYNWGGPNEEKVGKWGVDMTYRLSEYHSLLDEAIRVSYTEYEPTGKRASKLSFLYTIMLPDAGSKFPLYFGAGAGPGIFLKQLENESPLSLDYQLFLGLRLFNLFDNTGFYFEGGIKNHLQLTSDGQLNGAYISTGAIFTF